MTDDPAKLAHDVAYAATAARMACEAQKFQKALEGTLTRAEVADMFAGIAAGLKGLDVGPAGTVAWLRAFADRLERATVPPVGSKAN
jgi:hypothetical protein